MKMMSDVPIDEKTAILTFRAKNRGGDPSTHILTMYCCVCLDQDVASMHISRYTATVLKRQSNGDWEFTWVKTLAYLSLLGIDSKYLGLTQNREL